MYCPRYRFASFIGKIVKTEVSDKLTNTIPSASSEGYSVEALCA